MSNPLAGRPVATVVPYALLAVLAVATVAIKQADGEPRGKSAWATAPPPSPRRSTRVSSSRTGGIPSAPG
ncbi:hypothetical protein ABGB18_25640 [Nonomuraea sp. B12E4]|uniref:hypothetical protein n=1 Tax=Nonomuraea sp. B12E4 TaxID=3153564 RepID=UPI00325D1695